MVSKVHKALKKAERERITSRIIDENGNREVKNINLEEKKFYNIGKEEPFLSEEGKLNDFLEIVKGQTVDQHLISLLDPNSLAAEQFKKLRTKILQSNGSDMKSILITSSVAEEGKSLTAVNLAITIAQGVDEHVLLVDGDFRRPSIHKLLGLNPQYGLSDYLSNDMELSQILLETNIPKLKVLPAGYHQKNPSELLASNKMKNLFQELKSRYDDRYIIIDSTPIMATDEPDILAKHVDGIVLVIRAGETPREVIKRTLDSLNGRNILGIVFNAVQNPLGRFRYNYYYKYYQYKQ